MDSLEVRDPLARSDRARKALLVINPKSGGAPADGGPDPVETQLRDGLRQRGIALRTLPFAPRRLARRLSTALNDEVVGLFVAGGDGTLLAVVEALKGRQVPLGIVPRGTMNWVARDLGIPLDPPAAIDALLEARVRTIDVGCVNGRLFLCACMIGFGPVLARWRERERGNSPWLLWPKMLWRGLGLLQRYRHLHLTLTAEGQTERLESHTLVVTNNLIEESLGPMPVRVRLDAGTLGIYAVRKATAGELTRLGTRLMLGNWQADDTVLTRKAAKARLAVAHRRTLTLMLDGERTRLKTPLQLSIQRGAVQVLAPHPTD